MRVIIERIPMPYAIDEPNFVGRFEPRQGIVAFGITEEETVEKLGKLLITKIELESQQKRNQNAKSKSNKR